VERTELVGQRRAGLHDEGEGTDGEGDVQRGAYLGGVASEAEGTDLEVVFGHRRGEAGADVGGEPVSVAAVWAKAAGAAKSTARTQAEARAAAFVMGCRLVGRSTTELREAGDFSRRHTICVGWRASSPSHTFVDRG
jgi:hypothetical protein